MIDLRPATTDSQPSLAEAIDSACSAIAPSWPLDRQIAVNPFWGFIDRPFRQAASTLRRLAGSRFALPADEYARAWRGGEITASALCRALAEQGSSLTPEAAVAALRESLAPRSSLPQRRLPLLSDALDEDPHKSPGPRWADTITQQVSQYCASYFDEHQADWHRGRAVGLFAGWRRSLQVDHALEPLMHAPQIRARSRQLPAGADAAIAWSLQQLDLGAADAMPWLQACLLRINGWASWCAYLGWEARLAGAQDSHLRELLAIRAAWEALLHDGRDAAAISAWREQWQRSRGDEPSPAEAIDALWQRAHEISYQEGLIPLLVKNEPTMARTKSTDSVAAQLVFCIDVRSERLRRALEEADGRLETHGFAGFFGLPMQWAPIGTPIARPQLPGLLSPSWHATDSSGDARIDENIAGGRVRKLRQLNAWQTFGRLPGGTFALVETVGLAYVGSLLRRHFRGGTPRAESVGLSAKRTRLLRPQLRPAEPEALTRKAHLVAHILGAMGITRGFARLLVLVGHGSQSANNPHAASLDCGACGGQSGEINARVLAGLLNDPAIRLALNGLGIDIPHDTVAMAALHNTTTDEIDILDRDLVPDSHRPDLQRLERNFAHAGARTRAERAPSVGLARLAARPDALLGRLRRRARDWAETRPEWGLAGNAAFIAAPRARTRGLDLAGRCFLHDYDWNRDTGGKVLDLIMSAPMVVAHWINLQYYASTVDPERFGSGNKVLHNVACGRIGVFEGNTGDLRVGLSRQSVHDGERWVHAPLRLSVFIEAPRSMIEEVLARHAHVRQLVDHQWLHLFRFAEGGVERRHGGRWQRWDVSYEAREPLRSTATVS